MLIRDLRTLSIGGVWAAALGAVCMSGACAPEAPAVEESHTTVVLVRHAEKAATDTDPELTMLGAERAQALAHVLGEVPIDAVYATPFRRTRGTAQPLAELLGLEVQVVDAGGAYAADMAALVRSEHVGETVVVVSHSNTVPEIIGALGFSPTPTINDDEYDDLFVLTISADGQVSLVPLRYGAETP